MLKKYIFISYRNFYLDDIKKLQAKNPTKKTQKIKQKNSFYNYDTSFDLGNNLDVITL